MDTLSKSLFTIDTLLNIAVFVFIGLMIWLYFKDEKEEDRLSH